MRRLNQAFPERYPFLLQSTVFDNAIGRFDVLFAFPGESLVLAGDGDLQGRTTATDQTFLDALDRWWQDERADSESSPLPFHGGWFVYLGYELAGQIEPRLMLEPDALLPAAFAVRCCSAIVYDHKTAESWLVEETRDDTHFDVVQNDLRAAQSQASTVHVQAISEDDPQSYIDAVNAAKQHIEAGDIYQANLSREWAVQMSADTRAEAIYASLCRANPAPFAGIVRWRNTAIISSSPERLLQVRDGAISTRPIAGTRRRGSNEAADQGMSDELFGHPKERAEHVMLIDLERNDLGRVCKPGSVHVDEFMVLESYAHVHHIVSNVRGQLREDVTPGAAIAAVFPGGTITGCPKVRCMEIIAELEASPRGAYTGSFGYLNRDGSLDLNILIRTMVKHGNECRFRAGAGIVADSEALAELDESRAKAKGMLEAFQDD